MRSIFVSAGHSNTDPGACAFGKTEAQIVTEFRNMVGFYLSRAGVQHELDGDGPLNMPLNAAVKMAKKHQVAVEFHCNAAETPAAGGVEALSKPGGAKLGAALCAAIAEAMGIRNRGAKGEGAGQHTRLAFCNVANGVIVELFFITNPGELAEYEAKKWVVARAVADVLRKAVIGAL